MISRIIAVLLLITVVASKVDKTSQTDFYKKFVKDLDFEVETGYVSVDHNNGTGNTFYELVYKAGTNEQTLSSEQPLIIWLNGGPGNYILNDYNYQGCSSVSNLYEDQGPFIVSTNGTVGQFNITLRKTSWNLLSHVLYVDQPFGAGLSYTDNKQSVSTTDESARYFVQFLIEFYGEYPKFKANPLQIFGFSYAGHFIPAFGAELIRNQDFQTLNINFIGVGIGDGQISPLQQLAQYSSLMYSAGLVDNLKRDYIQQITTQYQNELLNGNQQEAQIVLNQVFTYYDSSLGNLNQENIQKYLPKTKIINPSIAFINFFKAQFKLPTFKVYEECNSTIYQAFISSGDPMQSRESDLVFLLDQGKKVMLYQGSVDFIINTVGSLSWINQMKWNKINSWKSKQKSFFKIDQNVKGWLKAQDNFMFVEIYQAGHNVVLDKPDVAYAMLQHYLNGDSVWI